MPSFMASLCAILFALTPSLPLISAAAQPWTYKHEAGRCALRDQCGKQSFFGSELPCPDNGLSLPPDQVTRDKLVKTCGEDWADVNVCCTEVQVDALTANLKKAEGLINSCPACKKNFFDLFCTFTCSGDQSLFVNVTDMVPKNDKFLTTEIDNLWSDEYGAGFYDSCKDVSFGATGGKVLDLIAPGAKNYTAFLASLGEKKFLGSPFQINFPRSEDGRFEGMEAADPDYKSCDSEDEAYRCACVDCPGTCPKLEAIEEEHYCNVGVLPCLSFAVILVYSILLALLVTAVSGHVAYQKHKVQKRERVQLLQDPQMSDDEDEGDLVYSAGMLERPQRPYKLNTFLDGVFNNLARTCATFPLITISISVLVVVVLSIGWTSFEVETDPVRLWVSPDSAAAKEKQFFDDSFGPFYRAEQAFLVNDSSTDGPAGPVLSYDTLVWWFDVEARVNRMLSPETHSTLADVCFNPTGDACIIQSLTGYFGSDPRNLSPATWQKQLTHCTASPGSQECLPPTSQPLKKDMILGGIQNDDVLSARALVVTWVVNNHAQGSKEEKIAIDWEVGFKNLMQDAQREAHERGLRLSFTSEMSLESELNKSTNTDAKIVVISYIVMFLYASIALGSTTLSVRSIMQNPASALVKSKFSLGVIGIIIVLMSVSASVGLFSACRIRVTLIIAEVIPFLVLAIGVDNIFLIVHEFERFNISHPDDTIETRMAKAMGRIGPSILLSAVTETVAFALGAAVGMPAVKNFAVYAAGAVLINALLQITMFVAILSLNQRRVEDNRIDCFPCVRVKRAKGLQQTAGGYGFDEEGPLQGFIRKVYAPFLMNRQVKVVIVVFFVGLFTAGLALIPEVALGLDQRIAFPSGSYLIDYFNDLDAYFNTGPPVYFVVRDSPVEERQHQQELCGRFSTCHSYSLANVLEQEGKRSNISHITGSTASWLDDFFTWLNPQNDECCVEHGRPCFADRDPPWSATLSGLPEGEEFVHYLEKWLAAPSSAECPFGGKAPYSTSVLVHPNDTHLPVPASHFRTSHTPLHSQHDFISSYKSARRIASTISSAQGINVFPYSKHYIFFDQYVSIIPLTGKLLGSAAAIVFVLTALILGSISTALVLTLTVAMIVVDILGFMALASVSLNAISLVNLIISLGIAVEFCAHIARAFTFPSQSVLQAANKRYRGKDLRAWTALVNVGGSVFTGIGVTKFLGVFVLAFTRSKIFEVYYFRIWLSLVVLAVLHSLVWLPVALSLVGGRGYLDPESDGSLEEDLAARRYRALLPDEDEEYESDDY